jgi:hypothetical protein
MSRNLMNCSEDLGQNALNTNTLDRLTNYLARDLRLNKKLSRETTEDFSAHFRVMSHLRLKFGYALNLDTP